MEKGRTAAWLKGGGRASVMAVDRKYNLWNEDRKEQNKEME
jgi:hypothetical protein